MSDVNFKGYLPAAAAAFCLSLEENYTPKRGKNAGTNFGPVMFVNVATKADAEAKVVFDTPTAAYEAAAGAKLPKGTRTYVDGQLVTMAEAAKAGAKPYVFKRSGVNQKTGEPFKPGWKPSFLTDAFVKAKNAEYNGGKAPTVAKKTAAKKSATKKSLF